MLDPPRVEESWKPCLEVVLQDEGNVDRDRRRHGHEDRGKERG